MSQVQNLQGAESRTIAGTTFLFSRRQYIADMSGFEPRVLPRDDVREWSSLPLFVQILERVNVERIRRPTARRFQIDDVEAHRM